MHKVGLVIGRFQPFHKGHAYLIKKSLEIADEIIIGVGSSNVEDSNNPFDAKTRQAMIEKFMQAEKIKDRVKEIIEIPDTPDDGEWLRIVQERAGFFDVVIGNNDWVKGIFEKTKIPVVTVDHYNRGKWEGYKIRELIRLGRSWKDRVPVSVLPQIVRK